MTFEINYKNDGDILYAADLMENLGMAIDQLLLAEYNFDLDADTSFTITPNYQRLTSTADYDDTNSTTCLVNARPTTQSTYDRHDDASIDTTKWTVSSTGSGSSSETSNQIRATASATGSTSGSTTIISNGSSTSLDYFGSNGAAYMYIDMSAVAGNSSASAEFQISNGSTHVTILSGVHSGYIELVFNSASSEVRVWKNGVEEGGSPFDLSTVTTNWYLRFNATRGGAAPTSNGTAYVHLHRTGKLATSTDYYLEYDNQTESGNTFLYRKVANATLTGQSATAEEFSINNGSSWSSSSGVSTLINAGAFTQLKQRFKLTSATSITVSSDGHFGSMDEIYYKYG